MLLISVYSIKGRQCEASHRLLFHTKADIILLVACWNFFCTLSLESCLICKRTSYCLSLFVFGQIKNLNGLSAIIVVSCVSKDEPHFPHPHNLVGANCKDGVCTIRLKSQQSAVKYAMMKLLSDCG